jgi:hypothetical protein
LFDLRLLFSVWDLQTFGHCVVYPCLIYDFCLALWYLQNYKDRQHNGQNFEDTKELNRSRKSNKDRQHNGQKFEDTKELNRSLIYGFCFLFGIFKLLAIVLSILV